MNLLLVIIAAGVVQICFSASIVKRDINSKYFTNEDIDYIRTTLKEAPNVDSQAVDNFANALYGFRQGTSDAEFVESILNVLALAVDADAFKLTKALSETVFARSKEGDEPVIEDDLKKLGEVLSKDKLTKLQVQQVIHFVRDLFLDTKPKESTNAMQTLLSLAARNAIRSKPKSEKL